MATIGARHIERLRSTGLVVSEPFVPDHYGFPGGVVVGKPAAVPGHSLPDFEFGWCEADGSEIMLDAPILYLHSDGRYWLVTSHDYVPGPGPGDFVTSWATPEEAIADIMDFFFGAPDRMDAKRRDRAKTSRFSG